jgi:hypothetical protein
MVTKQQDFVRTSPATPSQHQPIPSPDATTSINRRGFLRRAGTGAAVAATLGLANFRETPRVSAAQEQAARGALGAANRRKAAYQARLNAAQMAKVRPLVENLGNGEEAEYPNKIANYSKGVPHNDLGEVDLAAFAILVAAMESRKPEDFAEIPLGGTFKLENPQAALAFDLQGADSHHLLMPPAPRIDSARHSAEMAELYWMALARDVNFADYGSDPTIATAAADLSNFSDYRAPKENGRVTPANIFRGDTPGDLAGPNISQFLYRDVRYGVQAISHRMGTVAPGVDYLTDYDEWLSVQRGILTGKTPAVDPTPRYIRNLRDLTRYAHIDVLFQPYLNAGLILLGLRTPIDAGLPPRNSTNQTGFVEFGGPHLVTLVTEVASRALKAVWYQKWAVHRRLRPEEFGGRVHNHKTGAASYPINQEILDSPVLEAVKAKTGTYLLPQAYPEGAPTHPAYGAGHAVVAGACATMLKAFFDESFVIPDPVVPNADGTALVPYDGPPLTVGSELDKLAGNVSAGRNAGGIHWRSDYSESVKLGEEVARCILEEQKACHSQDFSWTFTGFDGTVVTI